MGVVLVRASRIVSGSALVASGAFLYVASWQRWAGYCPWGEGQDTSACYRRMDHLYDFLPPAEPWQPAGSAAQLAGVALLLFAVALTFLGPALAGRRPPRAVVLAVLLTQLVLLDLGVAILRSGLRAAVVEPVGGRLSAALWLLLPLVLFGWLGFLSRGWAWVPATLLVLGSRAVAAFTYAIGPFDANAWWEAISGGFTAAAGVCLLLGALPWPARLHHPDLGRLRRVAGLG